jgi:amino acid transporter
VAPSSQRRDPRAAVVAGIGIVFVLLVVVAVLVSLPGEIPRGKVNNDGQNAVAIGSAAITAIATIVGAYLGVKAANVAREETAKGGEKSTLQVAALAGALPKGSADEALRAAEELIERREQKQ